MIQETLQAASEQMEKTIEATSEDFASVRTGRANPGLYSKVMVDYYGSMTPLQQLGMERDRADYMGMLGTVMNCLALQDFLEQAGVSTRVQSAIHMEQVAEPYIPLRAIRHMQKGRVVIFGAGTGLPYFSTDTVAAQRALEIGADEVLMAKSGVDGVYTADPKTDPTAEKYTDLTYDEALLRNIRVMDLTAMTMCKDNDLPMMVFGMEGAGNVTRALLGERIGTTVTA